MTSTRWVQFVNFPHFSHPLWTPSTPYSFYWVFFSSNSLSDKFERYRDFWPECGCLIIWFSLFLLRLFDSYWILLIFCPSLLLETNFQSLLNFIFSDEISYFYSDIPVNGYTFQVSHVFFSTFSIYSHCAKCNFNRLINFLSTCIKIRSNSQVIPYFVCIAETFQLF